MSPSRDGPCGREAVSVFYNPGLGNKGFIQGSSYTIRFSDFYLPYFSLEPRRKPVLNEGFR